MYALICFASDSRRNRDRVVLLLGAATALATPKPPSAATITVKASQAFKPNQYLQLNDRYAPGTITIASGGTITLKNTDTDAHSLSLVKKSDVPGTVDAVNNCAVCGPLFQAHGINPNGPPLTGPPPHPEVNVAAPGFNTSGDSILVAPKGRPHSKVSFKVTAKSGTTLHFICIFHAWMQGKLVVK
jgi:plastocyanin